MSDASLEVQKALIAALKADATLAGLVSTRIYDRAPDNEPHPHVSLGPQFSQPANETVDADGWETVITIDTWSRKPGRVEANRIAKAIFEIVHDQDFTLDTFTTVLQRLESQNVIEEPDGITTHLVQRFRFWTC